MQRSPTTAIGIPMLRWANPVSAADQAAVEGILTHPGLVQSTLARLQGDAVTTTGPAHVLLRHLATGGAKQVYLVTAYGASGQVCQFVLKRFRAVQLAHLPPGATIGGARVPGEALDAALLARMVWAAQHIDERAPDLCPRFGGFWEWQEAGKQRCRVMTEAYVEGDSLERWKAILDERFVQGELTFAHYSAQRQAMERQAIAAYVRLWDVLGRQTFTSDPSPWNVLFTPTPSGLRPALIDLHSIHDGGTPLYLFQILEEQFGNRDEIREHALCPGFLDALGEAEGIRLLRTIGDELERQDDFRQRHGLTSYAASRRSIQRFLTSLRPTGTDGQPPVPSR